MVLESWKIEFIEVRPRPYVFRYLLVRVGAFLGWAEAFTGKGEAASTLAKNKKAAIGYHLQVSFTHCTKQTRFGISDYTEIV